jgi:hypothetical protein
MSSPVSYDLQGQGGGKVLAAGDGATNIRWIQCLNDCVFADFGSANLDNDVELIGPTIPAGVGIGGRIDQCELASGLAIAYYL